MPSYQGKTDEILEIRLPSALVAALWRTDSVCLGGEVVLEAYTVYVAEGAPIEITVKDGEGNTYATLKGKMIGNMYRARLPLDKIPKSPNLVFEANLPKHELKKTSGILRLRPPIKLTELKWKDEGGKDLDHLIESQIITATLKAQGMTEGEMVGIEIFCKSGENTTISQTSAEAPVKGGKIELHWNHNRARVLEKQLSNTERQEALKDFKPLRYSFVAKALGIKAESPEIPLKHEFLMSFGVAPGFAGSLEGKKVIVTGPDGKETEYVVPKDGNIKVEQVLAGYYEIDTSDLAGEEDDYT